MKALRALVLVLVTAGWVSWSGCVLLGYPPRNVPNTFLPEDHAPSMGALPPNDSLSYVAESRRNGQLLATIEVDTTGVPDLAGWGHQAADDCAKWYPRIADLLGITNQLTNRTIRLWFHPRGGVANTDPSTGLISISQAYIHSHPLDRGLMIHELVHTLQSYEPPGPTGHHSWLTEGIADYVRYGYYEPDSPLPRYFTGASYEDSYKTTATFLRWVAQRYDRDVVKQLNLALRAGTFGKPTFQNITGKPLDDLWAEFATAWHDKKLALPKTEGP